MKFAETAGIQFLTDVFDLLSSRNFATMATWHNDLFSLLLAWVPEICSRVWRGAERSFVGRRPTRLRPSAEDTTETGNRAWKVSGTQGTLLLDLAFEWSASSDHATANPVIV